MVRNWGRVSAVMALVVVLGVACSDGESQRDLAEEIVEDAGGVDSLGLNGEGTVTVGDGTFDFQVATCLVEGGSVNLTAASADPAVVVNSETGTITITRDGKSYTTTEAEITIGDGTVTATGTAEIEAGVPVNDGAVLEVTADCG